MKYGVLMHELVDDVGVAVMDLEAGSEVGAATLEGEPAGTVKVLQPVPLGHKIAMKAVAEGKPVIEYGRAIGKATQEIGMGNHVHTHNLKTQRWGL